MISQGYLQERNGALMAQARKGELVTGAYTFIRRCMYNTNLDAVLEELLLDLDVEHHDSLRLEHARLKEQNK